VIIVQCVDLISLDKIYIMSYSNRQIDPRFFYQKPKPRFGEILNANLVVSRDVNKDLMHYTQKNSEVKMASRKPINNISRIGRPYYYNTRHF